ncbi:hypothetical protein BU17DRAFT_60358 [Hysterangium stoloniferum]|nr:hypothetical protein BU17DRAFT_60358 [Hysterangium stoloniferum]
MPACHGTRITHLYSPTDHVIETCLTFNLTRLRNDTLKARVKQGYVAKRMYGKKERFLDYWCLHKKRYLACNTPPAHHYHHHHYHHCTTTTTTIVPPPPPPPPPLSQNANFKVYMRLIPQVPVMFYIQPYTRPPSPFAPPTNAGKTSPSTPSPSLQQSNPSYSVKLSTTHTSSSFSL